MPCAASSSHSSAKARRERPQPIDLLGLERKLAPQEVLVARRQRRDPQVGDAVREMLVARARPRRAGARRSAAGRRATPPAGCRTRRSACRRRRGAATPRSSSWPSTSATRSGQRANSSAVSRGSNACTGAHALNQATPSASGTRSTVAQGRSCAVSIVPTGSTCARIQRSAAARSRLPLADALSGGAPAHANASTGPAGRAATRRAGTQARPRADPKAVRRRGTAAATRGRTFC